VAAIGAAVMGYLILSKYIFPVYKEVMAMIGTPTEMGTIISLLMVVIVVVIMKALLGKGHPLREACRADMQRSLLPSPRWCRVLLRIQ